MVPEQAAQQTSIFNKGNASGLTWQGRGGQAHEPNPGTPTEQNPERPPRSRGCLVPGRSNGQPFPKEPRLAQATLQSTNLRHTQHAPSGGESVTGSPKSEVTLTFQVKC